jgi:hypothetical protein
VREAAPGDALLQYHMERDHQQGDRVHFRRQCGGDGGGAGEHNSRRAGEAGEGRARPARVRAVDVQGGANGRGVRALVPVLGGSALLCLSLGH